jgi:hypothetical protein
MNIPINTVDCNVIKEGSIPAASHNATKSVRAVSAATRGKAFADGAVVLPTASRESVISLVSEEARPSPQTSGVIRDGPYASTDS